MGCSGWNILLIYSGKSIGRYSCQRFYRNVELEVGVTWDSSFHTSINGFQKWSRTVSFYLESTTWKVANRRESTGFQCLISWWIVGTILAPSQDTDQRTVYPVHCAYCHTMGTRTSTKANFCKASLSGAKPIKNMRGSCVNYSFNSAFLSNLDGGFGQAFTTKIYH